eukprot:11218600-Ditylum_brightwellii.AAC.1
MFSPQLKSQTEGVSIKGGQPISVVCTLKLSSFHKHELSTCGGPHIGCMTFWRRSLYEMKGQ